MCERYFSRTAYGVQVTLVGQRVGDRGSPIEQAVEVGGAGATEQAGFRRYTGRAVRGAGRRPWEAALDS